MEYLKISKIISNFTLAAICAIALTACDAKNRTEFEYAELPAGCYRFPDGDPFFQITQNKGFFKSRPGLSSFKIGRWRDSKHRSVDVEPAFVLHDGTTSAPAGPARMAVAVTDLKSGHIEYERRGVNDIIIVPVEAYGHVELQRTETC